VSDELEHDATRAAAAGPRTLPPPLIDPDDLEALLPWLTPEDAVLYASLATLALEAALWPTPVPEPLPPPVQAAGLAIGVRLARAGESSSSSSGPVVSESIGAYTYRLASPASLEAAFALTEAERKLLHPWLPSGVYELDLVAGAYPWPADWWQRNLDTYEGVELEVALARVDDEASS
jgi:hypothetical protein